METKQETNAKKPINLLVPRKRERKRTRVGRGNDAMPSFPRMGPLPRRSPPDGGGSGAAQKRERRRRLSSFGPATLVTCGAQRLMQWRRRRYRLNPLEALLEVGLQYLQVLAAEAPMLEPVAGFWPIKSAVIEGPRVSQFQIHEGQLGKAGESGIKGDQMEAGLHREGRKVRISPGSAPEIKTARPAFEAFLNAIGFGAQADPRHGEPSHQCRPSRGAIECRGSHNSRIRQVAKECPAPS